MTQSLTEHKQFALDYLRSKAEADLRSAEMSLNLLMNHPAGIGDHSTVDFQNNLDEALNKMVDANDRLEMLERITGENGQTEAE